MWTGAKVPDTEQVLRGVLDEWRAGIAHYRVVAVPD